jgi:sentrin-specific protease 1
LAPFFNSVQYLRGAVSRPAPPPNPWRASSASLKFKRKNVALDQSIDSRLHPSQLPSALPPAQDKRVTEALNDHTFAAKGSKRAEVYYGDLQRLRPGQWLNDEVINYYGSLIMQRSGSEPAPGGNKENQEKTKGPAGANEQKPAASTSTPAPQDVKGKGKAVLPASESERPSPSKGTGLDVYVYSSFFYSKLLESDCYQRGKIFKWTKDVRWRALLFVKRYTDTGIGQHL